MLKAIRRSSASALIARLVVARRQLDGQVQAGGDAADGRLGEGVGQRRHEGLAAARVAKAHPPQVAVEVAARQELGERDLLDPGRPAVGQELLLAHRREQPRRHDEPAEPKRRRQRLARRAGVDHPIGLEPLDCADRRAVVAVLGVVVVLDRDRIVLA